MGTHSQRRHSILSRRARKGGTVGGLSEGRLKVRPSGRSAVIAVQQPTEAFANDDVTAADRRLAIDQLVDESLVRPLGMEVRTVLAKSSTKRYLTKQDHPVETLGLDREHPAFGEERSCWAPGKRCARPGLQPLRGLIGQLHRLE